MFGLTHHENQGPGGKFGGHQRKSKSRTTEEFPCCGRRDGRAPSDRAAGFARTPLLFTKWVWGKAQRLVPPATPASLSLVITVSISTLEQSRLSEYLHQGLFSFRWLEIKVRSKTPKTLPNPPRKPVRKSGSYTTGSVSASSCQLRLHTEHVLLYLRLFPFFFWFEKTTCSCVSRKHHSVDDLGERQLNSLVFHQDVGSASRKIASVPGQERERQLHFCLWMVLPGPGLAVLETPLPWANSESPAHQEQA